MSILIRGMEMPKNCGECKLSAIIPIGDYDTYSVCPYLHRHINGYDGTRRTDCPLIELPPHGRLIDADALIADTSFFDGGDWHYGYSAKQIENAPTIIEAEDSFFNSLKRGLEQAINGDVRETTIIESEEEET